jgi:hypothetical protein
MLRKRYDESLQMQYGGQWYAGRQDSDVTSTMERINRYPGLIKKHVNEVWKLRQRLGDSFRFTKEYEQATFNFLAAIDQAHRTGRVVTRLATAGAGAVAAGTTFAKSDCPTGVTAQNAEQALALQGVGERVRHLHFGTCVACQSSGMVGECNVCMSCEDADNRGVDLMEVRRQALARMAVKETINKQNIKKEMSSDKSSLKSLKNMRQFIDELYGHDAKIVSRKVVGDEIMQVVHAGSGKVLHANIRPSDFALAA